MQAGFSDLEYASKKKLTRRDRFLAQLEAMTPWAALEASIEPLHPAGKGPGRPPVGLERMLRVVVAQQCFGLSDEGIEDALYDSQAIRRFVGTDLTSEAAPANVHDLTQAHALLHGQERYAAGDAGYQGVAQREENRNTSVQWDVAMRPGRRRQLDRCTEAGRLLDAFERIKARGRAQVEHPFHIIKNLFRHRKTRYRGLGKNTAQLQTLLGLDNPVMASWRLRARDTLTAF